MRYLADPVVAPEQCYDIEEGVILDVEDHPTRRKAYDEWSRYWRPTSAEMRAEETAWAARSGPCYTIKKGRAA